MEEVNEKLYVKKMISKIVLGGIGIHFIYTITDYIGLLDIIDTLIPKKE